MKISIVLPWIRRDKMKRCVRLINKNAGYPIHEILKKEDKKRVGCPKMVKKLVERSTGDLVCFLGDDTLPQKDFLKYAVEDMDNFPFDWGLVGLNDGTGRILPTHWLASKHLLPFLDDEFFHTGYNHCCCDQELLFRCENIQRYVYSQKAIVLHDHPILKGEATTDKDYLRVYSPEVRGPDQALFKRRSENGWKT